MRYRLRDMDFVNEIKSPYDPTEEALREHEYIKEF